MPSAPIAINSVSPASSVASLPSSLGLYVPLHKRSSSVTRTDDSMSTTSSSRPSSRAESRTCFFHVALFIYSLYIDAELGTEHSETGHGHPLVYSRDRLMALAKSSLTMSNEFKVELRERLPEIVMSRKLRKAMEYRAQQQQRGQTQAQAQVQVQTQGQARPPVQAQQSNNAHNTGSNHLELAQQQQSFTGATHTHHHQSLHDHHGNQPGKVQHPSQKQPHIYSHTTTQNHGQAAVPRSSHPRPAGRSWWNAPKPTTNEMSWRRAPGPASISVA